MWLEGVSLLTEPWNSANSDEAGGAEVWFLRALSLFLDIGI